MRRALAFVAVLISSFCLWATESNCIVLDGEWNYWANQFLLPNECNSEMDKAKGVFLPHRFEEGVHYGTYHYKVEGLEPNCHYGMSIYGRILSSCRIWCNKQRVCTNGIVSKDAAAAVPRQTSAVIDFSSDKEGVVDIVIQVSDFVLKSGGITKKLVIMEKRNFEQEHLKLIFFSLMIISFLSILIVYNLILMFMNRKSLNYFSLVVVCGSFIISIATSGVSIFNLIFPNVPFWIEYRLPVLFFTVDICTYIFYMGISRRISGRHGSALYIFAAVIAIITAIVPIGFFDRYKMIFIFMPLCILAFFLFLSFRFSLKKNLKTNNHFSLDVVLYNFDTLVNLGILVAFFYDFVIGPNKTSLIYSCIAFKFGILMFGVMQCAIPAFRRYFTNYRIQKSAEHFELNNTLLAKFIPEQVLEFMDVDNITKIIPGTCRIIDAMIVYTEIRHFKQFAESIEPNELFEIVAEYYKEIAPIIRLSGGYIAKYMYHGFLAVFAERNDSVIKCAVKMREKMNTVRRKLRKKHKSDISIGIAIHTGKIACGVMGTKKRLDSVTFSPEVKTTIAIGMQTSKTNAKILISEDAMSYCRTYTDCMYEGHFILVGGKRMLVYNAMPLNEFDKIYDGNLELIEDEDIEEIEEAEAVEIEEN